MATDQKQVVELPADLQGQFVGLEKRLWRVETLAGIGFALAVLLLSYLALLFSDRIWNTPVWARVFLAGVGLGGLVWFGFCWLKQWVFQRRDQRALAVLVQRKYRRLGDRLLGIVELADERQRPAYFSPALYRAAIGQVAAEAKQFDFTAAVNAKPARRAAWATLGLLALMLILVLLSPQATRNAFQRWIAPTASIERFTLVQLTGLPAEQVVPHGEAFVVNCAVQYRSFWKPGGAVCQFERQPRISARAQGPLLQVRLPAQVQRGRLSIRLGDARAEVMILPTHRPSLKALTASVQLPGYLQYPATQESAELGSLRVLEGSRVAFEGEVSRPLAAAQIETGDQNPEPLRLNEARFSSDPLDLDGVTGLQFAWRDQLGLSNAIPWRLHIRSQQDSPPTPELPDLLKDTAILESEVLSIKTAARDDFGVREIALEWLLLTGVSATNTMPAQTFRFEAPTPREKQLEETFYFSPSLLLIPPDSIVEVRGVARDYYPDRPASHTPVYRIHVLGNERHAELVRQNLESLLSRLEEVTRLEEKVAQATRDLQDLPKEKLDTDEATDRISSAKDDQVQNAAHLDELAKEGRKTLREAVRNPAFSEEVLREWAKNLQDLQHLSEGQMQEAAQELKAAQQNPESRSEHLSQAALKEQDILDALEELQRRVNKGLDQLQALTLAQRLRKTAADENVIAGRLRKIVPDTIGMFPKDLPEKFRNTEASLAAEQDAVHQESRALHGEIGRFFERTQKETYGQVNDQMVESRVAEELDRVRGLIEENISMEAIQNLAAWSERFTSWADLLEPKSDESGGGGEGGEGSVEDEALIRELLALLRVRDREINLRRQTGLLERQKPELTVYEETAKALASTQGKVREELMRIQGENPVPALEFPLQEIVETMADVEALLDKPQTDRETDLVQVKTIEMLSDVINLINEQQQRGGSSSSSQSASAEEMAFLMQMMALQNNPGQGMGLNSQGGGNPSGGTTDRPSLPMLGDPNAKSGDSRTVNRASGSPVETPTEFREALEQYFRALESLEEK